MPPKKGKGKGKGKEPPPPVVLAGPPPKPKKIPPPPATFTNEDIIRYKEMFKEYDEDNIDKVKLEAIPVMLRRLGYNPKGYEIQELFNRFLEDDLVDTVELHEWYFMIEAKSQWGDDFEKAVVDSLAALGHDDEEAGVCELEKLKEELFEWGEPLVEIEFIDWLRVATKDKTFNVETGLFNYPKFVENMNNKDTRATKEPINYFKLDQKTLAAMAMQKAQEEKEEAERKEAERLAREEARRQRMIAEGLIIPD